MYAHDVTITYTSRDQEFAHLVFDLLSRQGLSVFTVRIGRDFGERGAELVKGVLRTSRWVLLLASEGACKFFRVWYEDVPPVFSGIALISVIWGVGAVALPGWSDMELVLNLQGVTLAEIQARVVEIALKIGADPSDGALIIGGVLSGLICRSIGGRAT